MGVVCIKREGEKRREKHLTCSLSIFPFRIFSSDLLGMGLNCCNDCTVNFVHAYPGTSEIYLTMKAKLKSNPHLPRLQLRNKSEYKIKVNRDL